MMLLFPQNRIYSFWRLYRNGSHIFIIDTFLMEPEFINLDVGQSLPDSWKFHKIIISEHLQLQADENDYSQIEMLELDFLSDCVNWERISENYPLKPNLLQLGKKFPNLKVLRIIITQYQFDNEKFQAKENFSPLKEIENLEKIEIFEVVTDLYSYDQNLPDDVLEYLKGILIKLQKIRLWGRITLHEMAAPGSSQTLKSRKSLEKLNGVKTDCCLNSEVVQELDKIKSWDALALHGSSKYFDQYQAQAYSYEWFMTKIPKIEFNFLQKIYLINSLLVSIEPMSRMKCPTLKQIDFSENKITSFKSLIKLESNKVITVHIQANEALQLPFVPQLNWPNCKRIVSCNQQVNQEKRNMIQSIKCFVRGNFTKKFNSIHLFEEKINESKIQSHINWNKYWE